MSDKDTDKILDALIRGKTPAEILGQGGVLKQLTKRLVERALEAEMTEHLGYEKHAAEGRNSGNSRNGKTPKTVTTDQGAIQVEVPRDRNGEFEPQIVAAELDQPGDLLPVPRADPEDHLHDERDRIHQLEHPEGDEETRGFSESGVGPQGRLPGDPERLGELEPFPAGLDRRPQPLRHRVRGQNLRWPLTQNT